MFSFLNKGITLVIFKMSEKIPVSKFLFIIVSSGSSKGVFNCLKNVCDKSSLPLPQTGQEATSTHKPAIKCVENISEASFKCVCLNARSIENKKKE